jgi:hypothetical protein
MDDDDLTASTPPPPVSLENWAELVKCPGWHAIVLPVLAQLVTAAERTVLTTHTKLTEAELRAHLHAQSAHRDFLSLLQSQAHAAFKTASPDKLMARSLIDKAFSLPPTFHIAVTSTTQPAPKPQADPSNFGTELNPFAGAVAPRPILPHVEPPPDETPTAESS